MDEMRYIHLVVEEVWYVFTERELNWLKFSAANYFHTFHSSCFVEKKKKFQLVNKTSI